jgi:hypothetical protein
MWWLHEKYYRCLELKPVFCPVIIHCTDWTITSHNNNDNNSSDDNNNSSNNNNYNANNNSNILKMYKGQFLSRHCKDTEEMLSLLL